ncbi:hypothetical protein AAHC03_0589 [Spirometra sp. Aus1]
MLYKAIGVKAATPGDADMPDVCLEDEEEFKDMQKIINNSLSILARHVSMDSGRGFRGRVSFAAFLSVQTSRLESPQTVMDLGGASTASPQTSETLLNLKAFESEVR